MDSHTVPTQPASSVDDDRVADYYARTAIVIDTPTGILVIRKRGPFHVRSNYTLTRWGARRSARRWVVAGR